MDTRDPVDEARLLLRQWPDRWRWLATRRDVFISYAHAKTSTYASNLRAALSSAGLTCYLDDLDFREGDSLAKTAVTQIGRARLLLRIEVTDEPSTFWMDLEREVARQQGIPVATLALGGGPGDPDELAFTDAPGDEPSAEVVVAVARRFTLRRWRRDAGVWRHPLTPHEPWRVLVSGDGDWLVLLQGATQGRNLTALRHHLRSGQTETAHWTDAPAAWLLGRCAALDGPTVVTCDDGALAEIDFETGRPGGPRPFVRNPEPEVVTFGPDARVAVVGDGKVDVRTGERWTGMRFETAAAAEEARFVSDDELAIRFGDGLSSTVVRVGLVPSRAAYLLGREILAHPADDP